MTWAGVEDCDDGNFKPYDGCSPTCTFQAFGPNPSMPGDILITEVMLDPVGVPGDAGRWFELYNPTKTTFDLWGCEQKLDSPKASSLQANSAPPAAGSNSKAASELSPMLPMQVSAVNAW